MKKICILFHLQVFKAFPSQREDLTNKEWLQLNGIAYFMVSETDKKSKWLLFVQHVLNESGNIDKCVFNIYIYAAMQRFIHSNGQKLRVKQTHQHQKGQNFEYIHEFVRL